MMGGAKAWTVSPAESGENTLVTCERGDYAADLEIARGIPGGGRVPRCAQGARGDRDPGREDDRGRRRAPRNRRGCDVEGDARRHERRGRARPRPRRRPARRWEDARGARPTVSAGHGRGDPGSFRGDPGSIGPVGAVVQVVADEALREGQYVAGANRTGHHLRGVEAGRDFEARFANIREVRVVILAPSAAARFGCKPRSRSGTSSSSRRSTASLWRRRSWTRTARKSL